MHQTRNFYSTLRLWVSSTKVKHSLPHIKEHTLSSPEWPVTSETCTGVLWNTHPTFPVRTGLVCTFICQAVTNTYIYSDQERRPWRLQKAVCCLDLQFLFILYIHAPRNEILRGCVYAIFWSLSLRI